MVFYPRAGSWWIEELAAILRFRGLLFALATRDFRVQYRQSLLGIGWAVVRPLVTMIVFAFLFRRLGRVPVVDGDTYGVSVFAALLPWQLFATAVAAGAAALVANEHILTKVYFPRVLLIVAPISVALVDCVICVAVLFGLMWFSEVEFTLRLLWLPLWIGLTAAVALAASLWLSAINAIYRDIRHALPFAIQTLMLVSPVVFETSALIPPRWRDLYAMHPLVLPIEGFRWSVLGTPMPDASTLFYSPFLTIVVAAAGLWFFGRLQSTIVDRV